LYWIEGIVKTVGNDGTEGDRRRLGAAQDVNNVLSGVLETMGT
jgi:hypothetical protein